MLETEPRTLCMLDNCSTNWATPPIHVTLVKLLLFWLLIKYQLKGLEVLGKPGPLLACFILVLDFFRLAQAAQYEGCPWKQGCSLLTFPALGETSLWIRHMADFAQFFFFLPVGVPFPDLKIAALSFENNCSEELWRWLKGWLHHMGVHSVPGKLYTY